MSGDGGGEHPEERDAGEVFDVLKRVKQLVDKYLTPCRMLVYYERIKTVGDGKMKQANFELLSAGGKLVACFVHRTDAEAVAKSFSDNGTIWYVRPSAKFVKRDPSSNWGARWTNGVRTVFDVEYDR